MNKSSLTLYQDLLGQTNTAPLSQTMPIALRLARELKQTDFEKWLRLEIGGYFNTNSALTNDVKVPEYRNVAGQHLDKYGRPIAVSSKLQFVNSVPLRNGIDELEKLASGTEMLTVQNPVSIEFFRETFNVEVFAFHFSPLEISGVLGSIKLKLNDWLYDIRNLSPELSSTLEKEIATPLENNPSIHINLGNGSSVGNLVVANSIANSFNKLESADISQELKNTLKELSNAVDTMTKAMSNESAEQVARDLATLTAELTSKSPRKQWWQLSIEGLKKAAKDVGEIGVPVIKLATGLVTLLSIKP